MVAKSQVVGSRTPYPFLAARVATVATFTTVSSVLGNTDLRKMASQIEGRSDSIPLQSLNRLNGSKISVRSGDLAGQDLDVNVHQNDTGHSSETSVEQEPSPTLVSKDDKEYPDGGIKAYSVIMGSFLGLVASFGTANSVGAMQTYLATHQLSHVSASTISWIFSIYVALAFGLTVFVGPYFDAKGALKPMIIGTTLLFCGLIATANCSTVWQFILALSLCAGIGNSLCISPLVGVNSHWFHRRIGLALAVSTFGGSLGGIVIPLMLRSLYSKVGFAWAVRVLAFFCLFLNVAATLLIKERFRSDSDASSDNEETHQSKTYQLSQQAKRFFDYSALKDTRFVFLTLGVLCGELSLVSVTTYYGTYAVTQGLPESQAYLCITLFNAMGFLRLTTGYLSDKFGHFNMMILMLLGSALSIFILWLPFGSNHVVLYLFILVFGFCSTLVLSLTPACLRQITPVREFGSRYGLMYFFVSIGTLFGVPLSGVIIGDLSKFHYKMFSLFCGLISTLATVFWISSRYQAVGIRLNVRV